MCGIVPVFWLVMEFASVSYFSLALTEISALKSFETRAAGFGSLHGGIEFRFVSAPGMVATRSRWLLVMEKPFAIFFSSEMVAVVSSFLRDHSRAAKLRGKRHGKTTGMCGGEKLFPGLVPMPPFKARVERIGPFASVTPLSVERAPLPDFRSPCPHCGSFALHDDVLQLKAMMF